MAALPVLGARMKASGDQADAPFLLGRQEGGLDAATGRLPSLWQALWPLMQSGLQRQAAGNLLSAYAGAASQHALRAAFVDNQETLG